MKVLVIGSGGREHAILWKLKQSPGVDKLYALPGNGGMCGIAQCEPIDPLNFQAVVDFVKREQIDLTIVGPEQPLVSGITDFFHKNTLRIFGPNKKASILEGDKAWSKGFCRRNSIPSAMYMVADDFSEAIRTSKEFSLPLVVKASGLAAGKGVIICNDAREVRIALQKIMVDNEFGEFSRVVIEEFLVGEEITIMAFSDGETLLPMVPTQDHKRLEEGDKGPNTGGMGAYGPPGCFNKALAAQIEEKIFKPFLEGIKKEGINYKGIIYFGLILSMDGPKLLEFNVRLGDPEAQVVLPLLGIDLLSLVEATISGRLAEYKGKFDYDTGRAGCCVVMASGGYPNKYEKDKIIEGLEEAGNLPDTTVFHAGTVSRKESIYTSGGRVLGVTSVGNNIKEAVDKSYKAVSKIRFNGMYFRKDIGWKSLKAIK